jgi:CTP:molybdopterin cytidylyltransferase MocA
MAKHPRHALVLAGSRGPTDPVAKAAGLPHKALVPVAGVPMLERVVDTLFASPGIEKIILCTDQALAEHGFGPALGRAIDYGRITLSVPKPSPSESVAHVLDGLADEEAYPLLITTADHPLLTKPMVEHLITSAPPSADFVVGLAEASVIKASYPDAIRTFYRFRGQGYSGCNLFLASTSAARRVVGFWRQMERHRKRPHRLVAAIGIRPLLRFAIGRLSIEDALAHLSRRIGAEIGMVDKPFAEAAIDVDKPGDLDLADAILKARA